MGIELDLGWAQEGGEDARVHLAGYVRCSLVRISSCWTNRTDCRMYSNIFPTPMHTLPPWRLTFFFPAQRAELGAVEREPLLAMGMSAKHTIFLV
jgi:hypothetical protein